MLLLKFIVNLKQRDLPDPRSGPLFTRWLPNGETDAVALYTDEPNIRLKVWFERRGFVDSGGFVHFDYSRKEVDPKAVTRQGLLDAGPLYGVLEISGLLEDQLTFLRKNVLGDPEYMNLGKRVAKLVCPPVARFLDVLRTNYGQYWIRRLENWDSREQSLGNYCRSLRIQWSLDEGANWADFIPDQPMITVRVFSQMRRYTEYLSREDYLEVARIVREGYAPSPAGEALARSHQFLDQGDLKYALIEGATAVDLAVNEFMREKLPEEKLVLGAFSNLSLNTQLTVLAAASGRTAAKDIQHAAKAIEMRNAVVHDGWEPTDDAKAELSGLHRTVAALLSGPNYRFPSIDGGNMLFAETDS